MFEKSFKITMDGRACRCLVSGDQSLLFFSSFIHSLFCSDFRHQLPFNFLANEIESSLMWALLNLVQWLNSLVRSWKQSTEMNSDTKSTKELADFILFQIWEGRGGGRSFVDSGGVVVVWVQSSSTGHRSSWFRKTMTDRSRSNHPLQSSN